MIRNPHLLQQFEANALRREPPDYPYNLEIFRAMLRHAEAMGALKDDDWLSDIEPDLQMRRAVHALRLR